MKLNVEDIVVYTALVGRNEDLNEQPMIKQSKIRHVCLTDNICLKSDSWEIVHFDMIFPKDNHRSQRNIKIRPHLFFPDYKYSLYIDNTVLLLKNTEKFISMITDRLEFDENQPFFAIPFHSFRKDLIEEFYQCSNFRLDSQIRIYEQLNDYYKINKSFLKYKPYWAGIIFRNHNNKQLMKLSEVWFANICRYSRRDQLSLIHSANQSNIKLIGFDLDNSSSQFHKWPIKKNHLNNRSYDDLLEYIPFHLFKELFSYNHNIQNLIYKIEKRKNLIYLIFPELLIKKIYIKSLFFIKKSIKEVIFVLFKK